MFKILIFILGCIVVPVIIGKAWAVKKEWDKYCKYVDNKPHQVMTWKLFNSVFYILDKEPGLYYDDYDSIFYRHKYSGSYYHGYKDIYIKFNFIDYMRFKHFKAEYEAHKKKGENVIQSNASNELLEIIQKKIEEELDRSQKMIEEGTEGIKLVLERMEAETK